MTSFPITIGAGLMMIGFALPVITGAFSNHLDHLPHMVDHVLGAWRPAAGGP
jgi:flagellar biosynthesis protein FliR